VSDPTTYKSYRETSSEYEFIAPLLFVEIDEEQSFPTYRSLKVAIENFAARKSREGSVEDISIYFRNLNTSQWVAVNAEERFAPASMLKVATLIATLAAVEEDTSLPNKRVRVGQTTDEQKEQEFYPPSDPVQTGGVYTVQDLIERLIRESDNLANVALVSVAGSERLNRVYDELSLLPPKQGREEGYTASEYSRLYRTLYNGTLLSRQSSEYALQLLSKTAFSKGIVNGLPEEVRVSHKFGVHTVVSDPGTEAEMTRHELHDCGIVYYPGAPYFVCVMTRGEKFEELEGVLSEASRIIWEEVAAL
jgi:beta-lactamase class A